MKKILILVGSLRVGSLNHRLANIVARDLPEGYEAEFFDIGCLPFYNQDLDGDLASAEVVAFRTAVRASAGVFIVSPEYNFSIPGVVKNAIDWASRPMMPRHAMVGKPMNVVVATVSATNGIRSLTDIKRIWAACGGVPVNTLDFVLTQAPSKFVDDDGVESLEPVTLASLHLAIGNLVRLIEANAGEGFIANWDSFVATLK